MLPPIRAGEPRAPKDAARKRRPALDCSRPPALFSFEGRSRSAHSRCRLCRLCTCSAQPARPTFFRRAPELRPNPKIRFIAEPHCCNPTGRLIAASESLRLPWPGTEIPNPQVEYRATLQPCSVESICCRLSTRHAVTGLASTRIVERSHGPPLMDSISPDGKPSGSSATHASCLSRQDRASSGAMVGAEPSAHKAPTIPHLETK